ncbi:IniB N-terminal domain-containing protein [Lentzea nigeriaca]|uniref:IniB N-terminal domain-containing protein n=1 Tax=Lentzea nigeriaca TaxID=1128665 RepID=UPI00195B6A28|nr:IniB N-terminal domain-containing protein [Lentzea nigeriaca]MBM7864069.1 hypothetical protein [Lentzea nigeriaca]
MQQTTPAAEPTTVQTGQTTVQTGDTTVQTGGTTVQTAEPTTLHDFTLSLLTDLDAREAFQQDPLGCLEAAGLSDITAADVQDILPLVLDAASVPNVEGVEGVEGILGGTELPAVDSLLQIAGNVEGVTGVTDIATPSAITALVSDFSGLGDVSGTLDTAVSTVPQATNLVSNVTDVATDNVAKVTDLVDVQGVHHTADALVKDLHTDAVVQDLHTDALVKNVLNTADVVDVNHVTDSAVHVTDNAVHNVAQVGDVHHELGQVISDVKVGDLDLLHGGVDNNSHLDLHI